MQAKLKEKQGHERQLIGIQQVHYGQSKEGPTVNFVIAGINNIYLLSDIETITVTEHLNKEDANCWGTDTL